MIDLSSQHVQLVIVDVLFLAVALGILMWFRSWLRVQTHRMDRRFDTLDAHLKQFTQIQERLQGACRTLTAAEPRSRGGGRPYLSPLADDVGPSGIQDDAMSAEGARSADGSNTPRAPVKARSSASASPSRETGPSSGARQHEIYERARQLLSKGIPTDEVAHMVDLGVAEVEVLKRMGELARSSSR
jgi:hypothetical protein